MNRSLAWFFFVLGFAAHARALPEFPKQLQKAADTPCLPHCNVCHRDDNAGSGTLDRPFVLSMQRLGGLGDDEASIAPALAELARLRTDSDGDGTPDTEELAMGNDPNDAYATSLCGPQAGCSLETDAWPTPWWLALALALAIRRSAAPARRRGSFAQRR